MNKKMRREYSYGVVLAFIGVVIVMGIGLYEAFTVGGLITGIGVIAFYLILTGVILMSLAEGVSACL